MRGKIIQKIASMPIFFQHDIDQNTRLAVWKIEEDENFFLKHVPLQRDITHPHKRLQHLAGRYLLKYLFPDFPLSLIRIADTRKPFLEDEVYHFSISHCQDFAAVIVSPTKRVGVDVEMVSEKIGRIQHKFLSDDERRLLFTDESVMLKHATLAWSCKEAMFKWYGKGEVDFRKHMVITAFQSNNAHYEISAAFLKESGLLLDLQTKFFDGLCLSWMVTGE